MHYSLLEEIFILYVKSSLMVQFSAPLFHKAVTYIQLVHLAPGAGLTSCALDSFDNLCVLYTHSHTNGAADWRVDWQVAVLLQIHAIDEVIRLFCGERQSFLQSATYKPESAAHHQ